MDKSNYDAAEDCWNAELRLYFSQRVRVDGGDRQHVEQRLDPKQSGSFKTDQCLHHVDISTNIDISIWRTSLVVVFDAKTVVNRSGCWRSSPETRMDRCMRIARSGTNSIQLESRKEVLDLRRWMRSKQFRVDLHSSRPSSRMSADWQLSIRSHW